MKKLIKYSIFRRNCQLVMFVVPAVTQLILVGLVIAGLIPVNCLYAMIPIGAMMVYHVKKWDLYNDVVILQKYSSDKKFREEFNKKNK